MGGAATVDAGLRKSHAPLTRPPAHDGYDSRLSHLGARQKKRAQNGRQEPRWAATSSLALDGAPLGQGVFFSRRQNRRERRHDLAAPSCTLVVIGFEGWLPDKFG